MREQFLKAIEEDRFELLPSPLYIKGFLSAYAKYIKIDPQDVLRRYERYLKGEPIISPEVKPEQKPKKKVGRKPFIRKPFIKFIGNRKQILIVSGVIAISCLISYVFHPYLSGPPVEPPPSMQDVRESVPILPTTQTQEAPPPDKEKPFSLEIKAIEETWVQIRIDGKSKAEAFFKPGEGNFYQATTRIELLIGNAGGVDLVFNGRKLERFGKSGEVITVVLTQQGAERKRPEERKSP